jgi:hypothetical protein
MELLTAIAVGLLFAIGVFQMLRRNVIRSVIGLMILANAVNLFLLSTGAYEGAAGSLHDDDRRAQRCAAPGVDSNGRCHQHGRHGVCPGAAVRHLRPLSNGRYRRSEWVEELAIDN